MIEPRLVVDVAAQPQTATASPNLGRLRSIKDFVDLLMWIIAIYVLLNLLTVRFVVQGPSMESTFFERDYLIVSRLSYMLDDPERGDVIVFHFPGNQKQDYIKRVIGIPGDVIEIKATQVYVNGNQLEEPYINEPCTSCRDGIWELDESEFFVMGDNRNHSSDSRGFVQPVRREHIVGEVIFRYWPLGEWGIVSHINYPGE